MKKYDYIILIGFVGGIIFHFSGNFFFEHVAFFAIGWGIVGDWCTNLTIIKHIDRIDNVERIEAQTVDLTNGTINMNTKTANISPGIDIKPKKKI